MSLPAVCDDGAVLITGASAGIGRALAHDFGGRGYQTILVARGGDRLEALAAELNTTGERPAHPLPCDLTDAAARQALFARVEDLGLNVDVLVNNAGFATGGPFINCDPELEVAQVRLMVEAVVSLTSRYLPGMVDRRRGAILNVSSSAGLDPVPYSAGYSAVKHHTRALSEALHYEVRRQGVAVTALCPGPVDTELWAGAENHPLESAVPRPLWISAGRCAAEGIDGLAENRRIVVPGLALRASFAAMQYTPPAFKLTVTERLLRQF
jgi:hypothetical protein